jgi:single-stranded-DNA-specific exonuclease
MELVGVRLPTQFHIPLTVTPLKAAFEYKQRQYTCGVFQIDSSSELRIKNSESIVLVIKSGQAIGLLGNKRENATEVDLSQPYFYNLVEAALTALEIAKTGIIK